VYSLLRALYLLIVPGSRSNLSSNFTDVNTYVRLSSRGASQRELSETIVSKSSLLHAGDATWR